MVHGATVTLQSFAATYDRVAERTIEPGWISRSLARVRARALDRALISGADPTDSTQLAARACKLTSPSNRALLASGIDRLLTAAVEPPSRAHLAPQRTTVLSHAGELRELVALLRGQSPLYARGLAMLGELLTDGTGPVYRGQPEALGRRLEEARYALAG
jgi:hypothetical protein